MKCKTCGKNYPDIQAMLRHYRKSHPSKLKRKAKKASMPRREWTVLGKMNGWL